jgi:hypothetical protein
MKATDMPPNKRMHLTVGAVTDRCAPSAGDAQTLAESMRLTRTVRFVAFAAMALVLCGAYLRLNQPYFPRYGKGGVGVIDPQLSVITRGPANRMIVGDAEWKGRPRTESETLIVTDGRVTPSRWADLLRLPRIVRFTPGSICVHEMSQVSGGCYLRDDGPE